MMFFILDFFDAPTAWSAYLYCTVVMPPGLHCKQDAQT